MSCQLVLIEILLETDTISSICCADEEIKEEKQGKLGNLHGQKVYGIRMSLAAKFPLWKRKLTFSFFFPPDSIPAGF